MILRKLHTAGGWFREHHKRVLGIGIGGALLLLTIVQLRYPADLLLPFMSVDGVNVGLKSKTAVTLQLDKAYRESSVNLYFGSATIARDSIKPADIGIGIKNNVRINSIDYPWYLRLAPGSLLWGHLVLDPKEPDYTYNSDTLDEFITKQYGETCRVEPRDATLRVVDQKIQVVKGASGGTCDREKVTQAFSTVKPLLTSNVKVDVPVTEIPANVSDNIAEALERDITSGIATGVGVTVGQEIVTIPRETLLGWIEFAVTEGKLDYNFNANKATSYLNEQFAAKVAKPAGVTTISTYNFVEVSRQTGASGQALDVVGTLKRVKSFINGEVTTVLPATSVVAPSVQYTRSYSSDYEGLAALMQNFATTHSGTYGVVLSELSGQYRRATYNPSKSFTTASTYKLFVAYSTLLRIENGSWRWSDQINGGRDLTKCFDDMIVLSDNACALALLNKIGFTAITNEAKAIGCTRTSFLGNDGIKSTPEDIALLLGQLQTGQILAQQSSRDILINAMKRNIYRQGIPKGVNAIVADKVGFLDGLLHDAAIVYASTGPYVLVIMTDGSSWANIAELTRQIEALRIQ